MILDQTTARRTGFSRRALIAGAASMLALPALAAGPRALPPLPLSAGARIAFLGDSYVQRGAWSRRDGGELHGYAALARGTMNMLAALDPRFRVEIFAVGDHPFQGPDSDNELTGSLHGLGGDRLDQENENRPGYLGRVGYCLAQAPDVVVIETPGGNNIGDGDSAATISDLLDRLIGELTAAGAHAVVFTMPMFAAWNDARREEARRVNDWLAGEAARGREGFHLADARPFETGEVVDPTYYSDDAHRGPAGTYTVVREVLLPLMRRLVAEGEAFDTNPLSANLFPRSGIPGTGGTSSSAEGDASDISGDIAEGMHVRRESGLSRIACAKEQIRPGVERQRITVTPVDDGKDVHEIRFTLDDKGGTAFADVGIDPRSDWGLEVILPVELDGWAGWHANEESGTGPAQMRAECYEGGAFRWHAINSATYRGSLFLLRALVQFYPGTPLPDTLRWGRSHRPVRIFFDPRAGGSGTVTLGSPIWRRLAASPAADWNL